MATATTTSALSASAAFVVGMAGVASSASSSSPFDPHWSLYPKSYSAPYTPTPIAINGDINKSVWQSIPFSKPFDEIRGADEAPPGTRPPPTCTTRVKMAWDADFLYIAALIESDMTVVAKFTERNSPIFQKDSDFEVFVDPGGSCHSYKELELNAINTVWNLMLDKPYGDGGSEHSGRVANPGDEQFYEVNGLKTATKILQGSINDDDTSTSGRRVVWSVEIALSHKDTLHAHPWGSVPASGSFWRINFSRVEKQGDVNWTWQPQKVWDPLAGRVMGKVDMHRPDAFGYVVFVGQASEAGEATPPSIVDPTWPARLAAMNVYYAQVAYAEDHAGKYAEDVTDLKDLVEEAIVGPFNVSIDSDDESGYVAIIRCTAVGVTAKVTNERLLTIQRDADMAIQR